MNILIRSALFASVSLVPQFALAQEASTQPVVGFGDIIVTAQKREEKLQDIPLAVTALSSEQIQSQRIQDVNDLATKVPSLTILKGAGGDAPFITLRGSLSATPSNPNTDNSASFYMDGVYLGNMSGIAFDISDIERIEVTRGPAGTLFGTNSTAGAINYITSGPKGKFYARQELTYSRFDSIRSKTRIDLPEWHGLSVSATYLHNYRGSDVRNINSHTYDVSGQSMGTKNTVTTAPKLGVQTTDAFHGAIRYQPFDGLDFNYKFDYIDWRGVAPAQQIVGFSEGSGGAFARGIVDSQVFFGGPTLADYVQQERSTNVYNDFTTRGRNKIMAHYLSIEYKANDYLTIKNTAAWRTLDRDFRTGQIDGAGGLLMPYPNFLDPTQPLQPFSLLTFATMDKRSQFSNETQFIIDTDPVSLTAGLFYYQRHTRPGSLVSAIFPFTGFPDYVVPGSYTGSQRETFYRSRQIAGYGQATYHVTPKIDLTGGIRYTQDAKSVFDGTVEPGTTYEYDKGKLTWLADISYKPNNGMMMYAKFTTGYVAGGLSALQATVTDMGQPVIVSAASPYKEETAVSWETGIKADFFDRRLRTNFALFYVTYSNLQQTFPVTVTAIGPISHQPITFSTFATTNIGKSRDYGLEYEIYAMPIEGLTLSATGAYNNFKYLQAPPGSVEPVYRPKFTANVGAEYSIPLSGDMHLSFQGDVEFRSSIALGNHRIVTPYPENDALNALLFQGSLTKLNARVTLSDIPLGPTTGRLSVWGRNLTNEQRYNSGGDFGTVISGVFDDPVTYGVDLAVEF